ncbi:uncharacterized protein PHACADRAFT_199137 [Phanerochaete carnosa HHB-10118-sp]|uniref:BTB domain-containing protein n=1 Tax=Phanerochaete carnosa (strain HHB-10118-sp) TaxID=650164 RepID=K5VYE6_PHACS|nr:uncharacterized protein PHACADRAFT_199137 [Phanerochaete carnosa HHB-10118-sp]EKM51634.1 hypothetical protein PHACADRAFT_199137 [Phanerochaete carnosa HHB-10118-sp]
MSLNHDGPRIATTSAAHAWSPNVAGVHQDPYVQTEDSAIETKTAVSSRFWPGGFSGPASEDLVLVSCDRISFYVHSTVILAASSNSFADLIRSTRLAVASRNVEHDVVNVRETSSVLNIILHSIYNLSCAPYAPTNGDLITAVDTFPRYGFSVHTHVAPSTAFFQVLLSRVHTDPLEFYALAGHHDLYALASCASAHLLGLKVGSIPVEVVERMGPVYLNRLLSLHQTRLDALKAILAGPPAPHSLTYGCDEESQASLARAWSLVAAYLIWEMRPQLTPISLELTLGQLARNIRCPLCKTSFDARLAGVMTAWGFVQQSI